LSRKTAIFRGFFLFFDETATFFDFCRVPLTAVFGVCGAEQSAIIAEDSEAFCGFAEQTHTEHGKQTNGQHTYAFFALIGIQRNKKTKSHPAVHFRVDFVFVCAIVHHTPPGTVERGGRRGEAEQSKASRSGRNSN
jgi:hypothetical protein